MATSNTAARRIVDCLITQGVTHIFCVPGESYLAILDALADVGDRIRLVVCRHEAGAANMAVAHGKLTGRPGICFVTRGPGSTHASIGVHTAQHDSVPMILFVGQISRSDRGRGAFQEVDYAAVFGPLSKLAFELDDPGRVAEHIGRAFAVAMQGRAGPVVVALPEDMQLEDAGDAPLFRVEPAKAGLAPSVVRSIAERLARAERPLLLLGGTGWEDDALQALAEWARELELPVALSFRRKDLIDNHHPSFIGDLGLGANPRLLERTRSADLIIALGARLGDAPTQGYGLFAAGDLAERLIHIHPGPEELGRVWPASLSAVADVSEAAFALTGAEPGRKWPEWTRAARAEYVAFSAPIEVGEDVNLSEVFTHLAAALPPDAIVCNGAGNYAAWLHRFYQHRRFGTQLAPTSGAMGFGFPAAIAAKLLHPDREVVAIAGDGCFMMNSNEMATAVQYDARIVTVVVDNGSYGTIRMHQERQYPDRVSGTDLRNPDFAAFARSFGAWATRVERTEDFPGALAAARAAGTPALIHIRTSIEAIAPGRSLSQLRDDVKA